MLKKLLFGLILSTLCVNTFAYEFSLNGKSYNYNEDELKFYETTGFKNELLTNSEVQALFPDYEMILVSKFNSDRKFQVKNSLFKSKKVLLLNDTKRTFHNFFIYPVSSRNEFMGTTNIKSLITIYGKKNVRLKHSGGDEFEITIR